MGLGVADLGGNCLPVGPECQTLRISGCARGGSHAVMVSFGCVAIFSGMVPEDYKDATGNRIFLLSQHVVRIILLSNNDFTTT
jgi:hypothetical protein